MTDHKKKGDFDQARKHDVGGNKKQDNSDNTPSRTGNQNAGHGGRDSIARALAGGGRPTINRSRTAAAGGRVPLREAGSGLAVRLCRANRTARLGPGAGRPSRGTR